MTDRMEPTVRLRWVTRGGAWPERVLQVLWVGWTGLAHHDSSQAQRVEEWRDVPVEEES